MTPPLFDAFLIVDWSAANERKRGKDSIWIAEADDEAFAALPVEASAEEEPQAP